jgi:hypothetical protein
MAVNCNKVPEAEPEVPVEGSSRTGTWNQVYNENEKYIESGSAYFSQAFAEVLSLVSDLELHDLYRAQLRLAGSAALLSAALEQYELGIRVDADTGLDEYHERRLRDSGLDLKRAVEVLRTAREQGHVVSSDDVIITVATTFEERGYRTLVESYLDKVRNICKSISFMTSQHGDIPQLRVWQEITWKLTASFAAAMEYGQCIAILNTADYSVLR